MPTDLRPDSPDEMPLSGAALAHEAARLAGLGAWALDVPAMRLTLTPEIQRFLDLEQFSMTSVERLIDFCAPESRSAFAAALESATREGIGFDLDVSLVTATGRRIVVRVIAQVDVRDGRPVRVVGVFQDITFRHGRDEERRRHEREALEAEKNEILGTFAGGVSHDFNNVLTGIMGYHELIASELEANSNIRDYVIQSRAACLRARDLLEQIVTFARQTAVAPQVPLDLASAIESARSQLRAILPENVAIVTELSPAVSAAPANAAQLHVALVNLGVHVARPIEKSGGTLFLRLRLAGPEDSSDPAFASLPGGSYACITVANTRGLNGGPATRCVFERSFTTGEMRENNGLALATVFRIVRAHHGLLCSESGSSGLEFRVYLPLNVASPLDSLAPSRPSQRGSREMIFVVDDEDTVAAFIRYGLQAKGYRVTSFGRPEECLEAIRANPRGCELLITDQGMPALSGADLIGRVRAFAAKLPVLLMSGNLFELPARLAADGQITILQKPFTTDELFATVQQALLKRSAEV